MAEHPLDRARVELGPVGEHDHRPLDVIAERRAAAAQRRARAMLDLCAGFVYSQVLFTCVRLRLFDILFKEPLTIAALAERLSLSPEATSRLLDAAVSLGLVERRGRMQARSQLLETVLEAQPDIQTRTIDMHIQRLRTKLGDLGSLIETVRGFGYRFAAPDRSAKAT